MDMDDIAAAIPPRSGPPQGAKAQRVYLTLKDAITRGLLSEGATLPGEQRLALDHDVSRVTVRSALQALENDGLIARRKGSGTVVRGGGRDRAVAGDVTTLMPQLIEMDRSSTARLLSFAYGVPAASVAEALGIAPGAHVQTAVRVRMIDGEPFSHLTTHVPEPIARKYSEQDLATEPLFRLLERSGVRIDAASQSVTATLATPEPAEALGVPVGAALLMIERVVLDVNGAGVEHLTALYRPDLFRLDMPLARVGAKNDRQWAAKIGRGGGRHE